MADRYIKHGDTWPPFTLSDGQTAIDLSPAPKVSQSIDGGEWEPAKIIDPLMGTIEVPFFDEGTHTIEFKIDWGEGRIESIPSVGPARVIVEKDSPEVEQFGVGHPERPPGAKSSWPAPIRFVTSPITSVRDRFVVEVDHRQVVVLEMTYGTLDGSAGEACVELIHEGSAQYVATGTNFQEALGSFGRFFDSIVEKSSQPPPPPPQGEI